MQMRERRGELLNGPTNSQEIHTAD